MVGILVSYWGGLFLGAMLVSGRVDFFSYIYGGVPVSLLILTAQTSVQPSHLVLEHVDGCHGMAIPWQDGLCDLDLIKSED